MLACAGHSLCLLHADTEHVGRWDDGLNGLLLSYTNLQSIPARVRLILVLLASWQLDVQAPPSRFSFGKFAYEQSRRGRVLDAGGCQAALCFHPAQGGL